MDIQSRSALWLAASQEGKLDFMECLLEGGADINSADAREKLSPIQVSVMQLLKTYNVIDPLAVYQSHEVVN